ncbi:hypothetical protein LWP59_04155 [Amycolatopsis acidiphila]|nr:hypothetical protein [Amycolatopsis acidiphila]UIJ60873.1 hypothetical protein LWP59_04155 [Amycolatopsis acidiphila]GHG94957.1 hypothetical protein GCM10017788_73120 [Amycolatopsis acidiphila]
MSAAGSWPGAGLLAGAVRGVAAGPVAAHGPMADFGFAGRVRVRVRVRWPGFEGLAGSPVAGRGSDGRASIR